VKLSSLYGASYAGFKAIDGIYLPSHSGFTESQSLAHTKRELSPWIQVDLEDNYYVDGVKIWDRSENPVPCELAKFLFKVQTNSCNNVLYNNQLLL